MSLWFCARCDTVNDGIYCENCLIGIEGEWRCDCHDFLVVMEVGDDNCYCCEKLNPEKRIAANDNHEENIVIFKCYSCKDYYANPTSIKCEKCNVDCSLVLLDQ